jgi:hypothetical protein
MSKRTAHFQAFGYEPLRMKPAHFASGFFIAVTGEVFRNELLNQTAVIRAAKGLLKGYQTESLARRLHDEGAAERLTPADVELLRVQINGVVNNDDAMYPAFAPYNAKGNDYTFISRRVLTVEDRTDGYAGYFVSAALSRTPAGRAVLATGRRLAEEPAKTLEQLVEPLIARETAERRDLDHEYIEKFGVLTAERLDAIAATMAAETLALERLCANAAVHSHYKQIRFYVLGLLAWLMRYLLKTAARERSAPAMLFDFTGDRTGRTRLQSKICYARLRETVGQAYMQRALAGGFDPDILSAKLFNKKTKQGDVLEDDFDFSFLETHFSDLALRLGYAQPRASRVPDKHLELQPDTLRVLMLSVLEDNPHHALTLDEVCEKLTSTWGVVVGANNSDLNLLREHGYFGMDEDDLRGNVAALVERLKSLNLAVEPSDGLVLCSTEVGGIL